MFIQHNAAQIFTVAFGSSPRTLVALGGWTGSWEVWADTFGFLSQSWRSVGFDHRGTGATSAPPETITVENMVADVFVVLDALEIEQCVLAAESSGAAIALLAALQQPQRFEGLVLVAGLYQRPLPDNPPPFLQGLKTNYPATVSQFVDWCLPETDSAAMHRWARQILLRSSQEAAIRLYECMDGIDLRSQVKHISQPTLLIHGDADLIQPVEASRWLAAHLQQSHLHIMPGAGHAPMLTFPQEIAAVINRTFAPI